MSEKAFEFLTRKKTISELMMDLILHPDLKASEYTAATDTYELTLRRK